MGIFQQPGPPAVSIFQQPGPPAPSVFQQAQREAPRGPGSEATSTAPLLLAGTGPSPIQLGRGTGPTLNDDLFPPGTRFDYAPGGTRSAQLPSGEVVDLTSVETYGRLVADALLNAAETGNPFLRPTLITEEWALVFKNLWEDEFDNVSDFLASLGYRLIPGTNGRWIRENPITLDSPSPGPGGSGVRQATRGASGGTVSRGPVSRASTSRGFGLTAWGSTPGA